MNNQSFQRLTHLNGGSGDREPFITPIVTTNETNKRHIASLQKQFLLYHERCTTLTFYGISFSLTFLLIAQVVYINFDKTRGGVLALISLISIPIHILFFIVESVLLEKQNTTTLIWTIKIHQWTLLGIICIYLPFILWFVILMFQQK